MDVKKIVVFLAIGVFFVGVVFSSGCTDFNVGGTGTGITTGNIYLGGNQGLGVTFPPNRPPSEIYGQSQFQLAFKLDNLGEYSIPTMNNNIIVYLSGINPSTYGFSTMSASPTTTGELIGKRKIGDTIVPGGTTEVVFSSTGYQGTPIPMGGEWTQTIQGRVCYPYQTKVISKVCLKQNIYEETVGTAACTTRGTKQTESSGAPVTVTTVEQTPTGSQKVSFRVDITSSGGTPYVQSLSNCNSLNIADENKITLSSMSLGGLPLQCTSGCATSAGGTIQLYGGKATIMIEADLSGPSVPNSEYEDILSLTFDYNFFKDISKQIKIIGT